MRSMRRSPAGWHYRSSSLTTTDLVVRCRYCSVRADSDEVTVICGQGVAPAATSIEFFRDRQISIMPGTGLLSAVVPGAFDAWMLMLRDHGTLSLREVLSPCIGYARNGFSLAEPACAVIEGVKPLFLEEWTSSASVYLSNGDAPTAGQLFQLDQLADTYLEVLEQAEAVGRDREAQNRSGPQCLVSRFRGGSD